MTNEYAIKGLKENLCALCAYGSQNMDNCDIRGCDNRDYIKALEQQKPLEKFENVKDHICKLASDYKCWDNRLSHEESLELCNILEQQSNDCVSRQAIRLKIAEMPKYTSGKKLASIRRLEDFIEKEMGEQIEATSEICKGFTLALEYFGDFIKALPPVTPTHGTCKDCQHRGAIYADGECYCDNDGTLRECNFYCKDFKKESSEE